MFLPVSFAPSATVADMAANVDATLASLSQGFTEGAAALGDLGLPPSGPGDLGEVMDKLRGQAAGALATPVKFMAITPFVPGVGTKKGEYGYLTPAGALSFLANRFGEAGGDGEEEGERALVVLMIAAQTQNSLAEALGAFNAVYPIPDLERAFRRAKALATLEADKFIKTKAPAFPPWVETSPQQNRKGQAVSKALGSMLASGEAAASAANAPGTMLAAFAQKQAAKIEQKKADLAALAESMTGGFDAWIGVYAQGLGPEIFRYLSKLKTPFDDAFKSTSLLVWYGSPDEVAYFRESYGLCKRHITHPLCAVCPGGPPPEEWGVSCPFSN